MNSLEFAAYQVIRNCVELAHGESVVLITDNDTSDIADLIEKQAGPIAGQVEKFVMENIGSRSDEGLDPLKFPQFIAESLFDADLSFYIAQGKPGELESFRNPMLDLVMSLPRLRHAHMIGITPEIFRIGMASDYKKVQELSAEVYRITREASEIRVTSSAGTDIIANFSRGGKWNICDGKIVRGGIGNLPGGEVYTCPANTNGVLIIDGVLGDYFGPKYGVLERNPVIMDIRDGYVVGIHSRNRSLEADLLTYSKVDENANRIGEFGIGTNYFIEKLIGNILIDEKYPGVHIAMGDGIDQLTDCGWKSEVHVDGVLLSPTVEVDGLTILEDGVFKII